MLLILICFSRPHFPLLWMFLIPFYCLIALARLLVLQWKEAEKVGSFVLITDLRKKDFQPFTIENDICHGIFIHDLFMLTHFTFTPS